MSINWKKLIVTDCEGESWGTLDALVQDAPANLDNATITDGAIDSWDGFFLSSPDEDPDWDTPHTAVDWTGFDHCLNTARED